MVLLHFYSLIFNELLCKVLISMVLLNVTVGDASFDFLQYNCKFTLIGAQHVFGDNIYHIQLPLPPICLDNIFVEN